MSHASVKSVLHVFRSVLDSLGHFFAKCCGLCFGMNSVFYQYRQGFCIQLLLVSVLCLMLIINVDENFAVWAKTLPEGITRFFNAITHSGKSDPYLICGVALAAYWMWVAPSRLFARRIFFMSLSVAGAGIFVNLIKITFGRARPSLHFKDPEMAGFNWLEFSGKLQSFPSGHTSTVVAVGVCLFLFWPKLKWVWLGIVAVLASSRVFVGAHFPADLVAGTYATILFMIWLNERFEKKNAPLCLDRPFPFIPKGKHKKTAVKTESKK